jgi:hypothetical protein
MQRATGVLAEHITLTIRGSVIVECRPPTNMHLRRMTATSTSFLDLHYSAI